MKYQFPNINHINDVLPAIQDSPEFIVAEREHFTVVNYVVAHPETFPEVKTVGLTNGDVTHKGIFESEEDLFAAIRRECRGLIFEHYELTQMEQEEILERATKLYAFMSTRKDNVTLQMCVNQVIRAYASYNPDEGKVGTYA